MTRYRYWSSTPFAHFPPAGPPARTRPSFLPLLVPLLALTTHGHVSIPGDRPGTIRWMAPEAIMHAPTEFSTPVDVYGFGMLLFELNTRLLPFPELQWQQIMMAVALHGTRPDIPGTWVCVGWGVEGAGRAFASLVHILRKTETGKGANDTNAARPCAECGCSVAYLCVHGASSGDFCIVSNSRLRSKRLQVYELIFATSRLFLTDVLVLSFLPALIIRSAPAPAPSHLAPSCSWIHIRQFRCRCCPLAPMVTQSGRKA